MNRSYKSAGLALLIGAMVLAVNPAWAGPQDQTQQTTAQTQQKQDPAEGYTEEEYDAYDKAVNGPDLDKRPDLLIAFMEKYPKSKLQVYIVTAYENLMFETQKAGNYAKLETLAERWQKFFPNDQKTLIYLTDAVQKQGKNEKFMEDGTKLFAANPSPALAYMLYETAQKMKDDPKQMEWGQKLLGYPEYNDNFMLRMYFVAKYAGNDIPKAAGFAQQALKSLALAKKAEATPQADWNKAVNYVQKTCNNILGLDYYQNGKFPQAIQALEKVLQVEKSDEAYYYIGMSQWKLNSVEDATLSFAVSELLKGEYSPRAKENVETLYKGTHNGNTTGIDKLYRRAQAILDGKGAQ